MQQGDAGGLAVLDGRHDDDGAAVAPALGDQHLALAGDAVLGAPQLGRALGAAGQVPGDATPVDDGDRGGALDLDPPVDLVAGEAQHLVDAG